MSEDLKNSAFKPERDAKTKMLAALARKQKGKATANNSRSISGSKIGAGQTMGSAPKIHRRKAGST